LYDSPWVYIFDKNGKRKRYRKKREKMSAERFLRGFGNALAYFIIPPVCLIVWAVLGALGVMIYLTAFGF
ncbi:MAG: hypothetical protein MJ067_06170, partial [Oscillospiraceae bacterium]|nr:hypothetical protein [Oscillospiraceae bacterium]